VSANRAGFGFVRIEGQEEAVFLPPPQMAGVMHGDRVRVSVERGRDGRYSGRLEKILEHATKAFVGTLEVHGRTAFVTSADRRIGMRCLVPPDELGGARHGDWVIAVMTRYAGSGASPQARIVKRLDPEKPVELACESAIARFDLPREFSPEAVREAESYGNEVDAAESARRVDLRNLPLVTIDGEDAKDFDDAVYCEPHAKGFRLIVAIADVSYYVRRGTALDASARERGTSVYFPTRVIPMLPFALSNVLCSLQPNVDRLCFASEMIVSHRNSERETARVLALANMAAFDVLNACFDAKFAYYLIRPSQADPLINLPVGLPNHPSYPSGHSCITSAYATVLASVFPDESERLQGMVVEAGLSRMYGGLHYRFDCEVGQALGRDVAEWVMRVTAGGHTAIPLD